MPSFCSCLWTLGLVAALIAGCGGSSGSTTGGGGGNPTTVTFTFVGNPAPTVAARIGSGSFTPTTLSSNALTLSIPEGTTEFAVAYLCPAYPYFVNGIQYSYNDQYVIEASTEDQISFTESCPSPNLSSLTFDVDASAIPGAQNVLVEIGNNTRTFYCYFGELQTGPQSCITPTGGNTAFVDAYAGSISANDYQALAVRRYDGQTAPGAVNGGATVTLGAADETTSAPLTYQNLPAGFAPYVYVYFDTAAEGNLMLAASSQTYMANYPQLPTAAAESGDHYSVEAQAWNGNSACGEAVGTNGSAATIQYPFPWSYAGPSSAALPVFDFSSYSGFNNASGLDRHADLAWSPSNLVVNHYRVSATANAANGSASVAYPDLSGVGGFLANPGSGTTVDWLVEVENYSAGAMAPESAGTTRSWVENEGSFVVP